MATEETGIRTGIRVANLKELAGPIQADQLIFKSLATIAMQDPEILRAALVGYVYAPHRNAKWLAHLSRAIGPEQSNRDRRLECHALNTASRVMGSYMVSRAYRPHDIPAVLRSRLGSDPDYQRAYRAWLVEPQDPDLFKRAGVLYLANAAELVGGVPEREQKVYVAERHPRERDARLASLAPIEDAQISVNGVPYDQYAKLEGAA